MSNLAPIRRERSALATPGDKLPMIQKALASAADVVIVDLEDAVAPGNKPGARATVIEALTTLDWGDRPRLVRVNALDTPWCYRDLVDLVEGAGNAIDLLMVPKVNRPEDVYVVATLLRQMELAKSIDRPIGLEIQIETAAGMANSEAIAAASPRIEAVVFGPGDYAASIGLPLTLIGTPDRWDASYPGHRLHYPMHRLLVAGRAAGVRVIDGPYADFRDLTGLRRACESARAMGYDGKWAIHPAQVAMINEVFAPTGEEIMWARRVIAAYEEATSAGQGAISLDGAMIDAASLRMAESTLARLVPDEGER